MSFNPGLGGGSSSIASSTDVSLSSVQNDQVLAYDQGSAKWQNKAAAGAGVPLLATPQRISLDAGASNAQIVQALVDLGLVVSSSGTYPAWVTQLGTESSAPLAGAAPHVEFGGGTPTYTGGIFTTSKPTGTNRWRSEYQVASSDQAGSGYRTELVQGDIIVTEFDIMLSSSFNGQHDSESDVLWQLIGRTQNNQWPPPPIVFSQRRTNFRMATSPYYHDAGGNQIGSYDQIEFTVANPTNAWRHVVVGVLLDGPGQGTVNMWMDGVHHAQNWKPANGTYYTNQGAWTHSFVFPKLGLYGGTDGTMSPVAKQVQHKNLRMSVTRAGTTTTWRSTPYV